MKQHADHVSADDSVVAATCHRLGHGLLGTIAERIRDADGVDLNFDWFDLVRHLFTPDDEFLEVACGFHAVDVAAGQDIPVDDCGISQGRCA